VIDSRVADSRVADSRVADSRGAGEVAVDPEEVARGARETVAAMQRARRLASFAVVVAVGVLALAGCKSAPGVAAYVGDQKITEKRVDDILADVKKKLAAVSQPAAQASPTAAATQALPGREMIVSTLVLNMVCDRLAADRGTKFTAVDINQVAQAEQLPAASTYMAERTKLYSCLGGVETGASATPTEAELREVYDRGKAAGAIPKDQTFEQIAPQLVGTQLNSALAAKHTFTDVVAKYQVTVNPRYRPLELPLLSFSGNAAAVSVPLGQPASDAVHNLS
jgi:hypothetical protein